MALLGIAPDTFWMLEVWEYNRPMQVWENKQKQDLILWRKSTYYQAAHFFKQGQVPPTMERWHPFPFDEEFGKHSEIIPYDRQIEFAIKKGRQDWIPNHWYKESESYKHLAK